MRIPGKIPSRVQWIVFAVVSLLWLLAVAVMSTRP